MVVITIHDSVNCHVGGLTYPQKEYIIEKTKLPVKGSHITAAFQTGNWDGKESLFQPDGSTFIYMLNPILDALDDIGVEVDDIIDNRTNEAKIPEFDEVPLDIIKDETGFELREHQQRAVQQALNELCGIIVSSTSSGKTAMTLAISKLLDPYIKTLISVPSKYLADQTYDYYAKSNLDVIRLGDFKPKDRAKALKNNRHIIITNKMLQTSRDLFVDGEYAILRDECYHPSHMLLTRNGWKYIQDVEIGEEVMAYDTNTMTARFEAVYDTTEYEFEGNLCHLHSKSRVDLLVTPDHEQSVWSYPSRKHKRIKMKDFRKGNMLQLSASLEGEKVELTPMERLKIAFEADGCLLRCNQNGTYGYRFAFRRQRKYDKIKEILTDVGVSFNELTNNRNDLIITFVADFLLEKSLVWFNPLISGHLNLDFVTEVGLWDGTYQPSHRTASTLYIEWNCSRREDIEIFQLAATTCGFRTTVSTPSKLKNGEVNYRVACYEQGLAKMTSLQPVDYEYSGNVFCVSVPSKNLITKRDTSDVISISGNCHQQGDVDTDILMNELRNSPVRLGFTGSMPADKQKCQVIKSMLGEELVSITVKEMTEKNIVSRAHIKQIATYDLDIWNLSNSEMWDWDDELSYMATERRLDAIVKYIKALPRKNTLILCNPHSGVYIGEFFGGRFIRDSTNNDDRRKWLDQFDDEDNNDVYELCASFGTSGTGISVNQIQRVIMVDIGKAETLIKQSIGRGLRLDGKDNEVEIIDISAFTKYGERHRKERLKIYKAESMLYDYDKDDYIKIEE